MIIKKVLLELTQEEIDSVEDIKIEFSVQPVNEPEEGVTYTITYPK